MTKDSSKNRGGKAAIAGAIGSAAIAAAVLYANRRKEKKERAEASAAKLKEQPETD